MQTIRRLSSYAEKQNPMHIGVLLSDSIENLLDNLGEGETYKSICSDKIDLYKSPRQYIGWNFYVKMISIMGSQHMSALSYLERDCQSGIVSEICRQAIAANAPARYISKELCEAFMRTPTPLLTQEALGVLPYLHILLPRHLVYDADGEEVQALMVKTGELHPTLSRKERELQEECNRHLGGSTIPPLLEGARGIEVATISETGSYFWIDYIDENAKSWYDDNVRYGEGKDITEASTNIETIARIAVNSLLVHLYEPELISTDKKQSVTKALGFNKSVGKQPLAITWIGKSFHYQRAQENKKSEKHGEKKIIRAHWRRGHWHSYLQGVGRTQRTVKWIKPIYVRGEK